MTIAYKNWDNCLLNNGTLLKSIVCDGILIAMIYCIHGYSWLCVPCIFYKNNSWYMRTVALLDGISKRNGNNELLAFPYHRSCRMHAY